MPKPHTDFPADYLDWPEGGEALARLLRAASPELSFGSLRPIADRLLTGPGLTDHYKAKPGQTARAVLVDESPVVCMLLQAWCDRAEAALGECDDQAALERLVVAVRVIRSAVRYMPPSERAQ